MKSILPVLIALFCLGISATAQPNLRSTTLPAPFKTFGMRPCDTTGVRVGPGGTGLTWNYANLKTAGTDSVITSYSDSTALTMAQRTRFRNAEVVVKDDTTTSIYRTVTGSWRLVGRITPTTEMVVGVDPYDVRPSEIVFNDPKSDKYNGNYTSAFPVQGSRPFTGGHSYVYDGLGTLQLPLKTYVNVARVTWRDSVSVTVQIGATSGFLRIITRTVSWQEVNSNVPLLVIEEKTISVVDDKGAPLASQLSTRSVRIRGEGQSTSVTDDPFYSLLVWPSPASGDHITVKGLLLDPATVTVINAAGQAVACPVSSIDSDLRIDVRSLPAGTFYVLIAEDYRIRTASFVRMR